MIIDLIIGACGSLVAALILWLLARIYLGKETRPGIKLVIRMIREFIKAGGFNFYSSRKSYLEFKDHGSQPEYMMKATSSFIYVGFWLSSGDEVGNPIDAIRNLVESGKTVTIVLMNPDSEIITPCSQYLSISEIELSNRINMTLKKLCSLHSSLSESARGRLSIKVHNVPLSASAFLIDNERAIGSRILIDFKPFGLGLGSGFGMEFRNKGGIVHDKLVESYLLIVGKSEPVNCSEIMKEGKGL